MTSEEFTEMESPKISKYNSAISQLMRLDYLWQDCHRHSREGKYLKWNADLDRVWCELAQDIKEKDKEEKDFNDLNKEVANAKDNNSMYKILMKKEVFLRRLQNKQGKGTAYEESFDEYMNG